MLEEKKEALVSIAELLLEKETINQDDVIAMIGERPFEMQENQKAFLKASFSKFEREEEEEEEEKDGEGAEEESETKEEDEGDNVSK